MNTTAKKLGLIKQIIVWKLAVRSLTILELKRVVTESDRFLNQVSLICNFCLFLPIQNILPMRFRQIVVPIFMGLIVYFVGAVTTLRILPPVCFVFCCLTVVTLKLKKSRWKVDTFGLIEHSDPR